MVDTGVSPFHDFQPEAQIGVIPTAVPILALGLAIFGLLARRRSDELGIASSED
jgi:hypothetical protein